MDESSPNLLRPPMEVLPHRDPFLFLDRMTECSHESASGEYTFKNNDFFRGHFPDRPIVPGVILLEGMAQALAYLALTRLGGGTVLLTGVDAAKIRRPVLPGETVVYRVTIDKYRHRMVVATGKAYVGETLAAQATLKGFVESEPD